VWAHHSWRADDRCPCPVVVLDVPHVPAGAETTGGRMRTVRHLTVLSRLTALPTRYGRVLTCTSCRQPVEVIEVPEGHIDADRYVCGDCSTTADGPREGAA